MESKLLFFLYSSINYVSGFTLSLLEDISSDLARPIYTTQGIFPQSYGELYCNGAVINIYGDNGRIISSYRRGAIKSD